MMNETPSSPPRRRYLAGGLLLMLACAPLYMFHLGDRGLSDPDEGRNAEVAREMLISGDYVTPRINDAVYLDKPPAFFWAVALSYRLFGVNEFAARLPAALSALAGIGLAGWFARRHAGRRAGWLCGLVLALTPMYMIFGRTVIFDMMLVLCMSVSVIAAYEAMEGEAARARLPGPLAFGAAGLGTIIKGPVALAVPLLVVVIWALLRGRPARLARLRPLVGLAVFTAVILPWVWLVSVRNPGYLQYALIGENLQRMTSNKFDTARPLTFYVKFVIPAFFPWILYACGVALRRGWLFLRRRGAAVDRALNAISAGRGVLAALRAETDPRRLAAVFAGVWAIVVFLFFSLITSKRPSYLLPCSVPIALATGMLWARALTPRADAPPRPGEAGDGTSRTLARADLRTGATIAAIAALALAALCALPLVPGATLQLPGQRYEAFVDRRALFGLTAGLLALAGILMLATRRLRRPWLAFGAAVLSIAALVPLSRSVARYIEAERSSRAVSRYLEERLQEGDLVICFEEYRPGLNFYLRRPIHHVTRWGRIFTSNYIEQNLDRFLADPGFRLMPADGMQRALRDGGRQVYILAPRKQYDLLADMAEAPLRRVYEDPYGGLFVREPAAGI